MSETPTAAPAAAPAARALSVAEVRAQQNFALAAIAGVGAAIVGAVVWAIVTVITEMALRLNSNVQTTMQQLSIEEKRLQLAKASRIPNLDLQAGVDFNSPPDFNVGPRGQVGVTLPLFNHGQGEIAQSNARLDLLRFSIQAQKTTAEAQVIAAYYDYDTKLRLASDYSKTIVPQTARVEEMAEESYRAGKSNLLTLIDAQRRLNETRKAYLSSLFSVQSAFSALEEVVGGALD